MVIRIRGPLAGLIAVLLRRASGEVVQKGRGFLRGILIGPRVRVSEKGRESLRVILVPHF